MVAFDQFLNALLGGEPDVTVSYRLAHGRHNGKRFGCILCKLLHLLHRNHCERSIINHNESRKEWVEHINEGLRPK